MLEELNWLDAQAKAIVAAFITTLGDGVGHILEQPWTKVQRDIVTLTQSLAEENAHRAIDKPSESHLLRSSLLLAAYRVLLPLIEKRALLQEKLHVALYGEIEQAVEAYLVKRFGISPDAPEEAFDKASVNFKKIGDEKFGRAFIYEREMQDEAQSINIIRKCFFNDFFRANEALELLPLLCAGDELWMEELNKPKYGVRSFRTALLSKGDDACRFHFMRADPPR